MNEARAADIVLADRYVVPLVHVSSVDTTLSVGSISAAAHPRLPSGPGSSGAADWSEFTTPGSGAGLQSQPPSLVVLALPSDGLESAAAAVSFAQLLSLCTEGPDTRALADKAVEVSC